MLQDFGKSNPSARDFVTFSGRGQVHDAIVGGPKEVAGSTRRDVRRARLRRLCHRGHHHAGLLRRFRPHVVPELQRRGLFHKDYAGKTLRENLGLHAAQLAPGNPRRGLRLNNITRG